MSTVITLNQIKSGHIPYELKDKTGIRFKIENLWLSEDKNFIQIERVWEGGLCEIVSFIYNDPTNASINLLKGTVVETWHDVNRMF